MSTGPSVVADVRRFLHTLADAFRKGPPSPAHAHPQPSPTIAETAFGILTRRDFTYLTKSRATAYRASILAHLAADARAGRALRFSYDLGGGYRAGIDRHRRELSFSPDLGELLALRQIVMFDHLIRAVYAPGTTFSLVIDNICALLVNDIPLHRTSGYCHALRTMIRRLDLEDRVDLLVESEHFHPADYRVPSGSAPGPLPSADAVENVSRFLGRTCGASEARERIARYDAVSAETEKRLGSIANGVRLTQRATPFTFAFRSFPGGDSRIQCGDVVLAGGHGGRVEPRLVTSQSPLSASVRYLDVSNLLPLPSPRVGYVVVAEPVHR